MTDLLDIGSLHVSDGFFLGGADALAPAPFRAPRGRTVFTRPGTEASLRDVLYDLVDSATHKLFVCSFLLDDQGLVERLCRKADELRGGVYVVTALKDEWLASAFADPDEAPGRPTKHLVEPLVAAGVQVRGCENAHAKFAIADDRNALISTANFDTRGLLRTGEAGVRLSAPDEVLRLSRFFSRLWLSRCELEMPHDPSERFTVRNVKRPPHPPTVPVADLDLDGLVVWTDGPEHLIAEAIGRTADAAQGDLVVATYDTRGLERLNDLVLDPLTRAIRRGVRVRLLTRIRNPRRATRDSLRRLAAIGVEIRGDSTNHAKFIVADRRQGALFSANLDAEHGLTSGIEVGMTVSGEDAGSLCGYFDEAFHHHQSAPFVDRPTHRHLDSQLRAAFRRPWGPGRDVTVRCDRKTWESFHRAVTLGDPVLYQATNEQIALFAASEAYAIMTSDESMVRLPRGKGGAASRTSGQLLDLWMSDRGSSEDPRGIFAGVIRPQIASAVPAAADDPQRGAPART